MYSSRIPERSFDRRVSQRLAPVASKPIPLTRPNCSSPDALSQITSKVVRVAGGGSLPAICLKLSSKRSQDQMTIATRIAYNTVNAGNADRLLYRNPSIPLDRPLELGANYYDWLAECACRELNRRTPGQAHFHDIFENLIVRKVARGSSWDDQSKEIDLTIASFGPGRLFGEFCVMNKLFSWVREEGLTGTIRLCLVDRAYKECLDGYQEVARTMERQQQSPAGLWTLLGSPMSSNGRLHALALQDFPAKMAKSQPSGVKIKIRVFSESEDYKRFCLQHPAYRNNLLMGGDIEDTLPIFKELQRTTQQANGAAFALLKDTEGAFIWKEDESIMRLWPGLT